MRFPDVDIALQYAFGVECWSFYGESVLAGWMNEAKSGWKPPTGLNRRDHLTYAGKITQLARETLNPSLFGVIEAYYIVPAEAGADQADRHRTDTKIQRCAELLEWSPLIIDCEVYGDRYSMDQIRDWADLKPIYNQKEWADILDINARSLRRKNKALVDYLNNELTRAQQELEIAFCEAGVIGSYS